MPLSMTAKAVLCLCPPAVMAGTVATVPAAKRAVHHLTAQRHAPASARPAATHATARPAAQAHQIDCDPVAPAALPAVPIVTYAAPIPDEPGGTEPVGGGSRGVAALATQTAGATVVPIVSPPPVTPFVPGAVPEPATWLMIIGGVGVMGVALRRRRTIGAKAAVGATLWSSGAVAEAGEMAATVAVRSTVAAKTTAVGVAGKALMCVCPAALVAGSVMTVPPLRQAVHASTATPDAGLPIETSIPTKPCDEATAIPVSTGSLTGFPASVVTLPAKAL